MELYAASHCAAIVLPITQSNVIKKLCSSPSYWGHHFESVALFLHCATSVCMAIIQNTIKKTPGTQFFNLTVLKYGLNSIPTSAYSSPTFPIFLHFPPSPHFPALFLWDQYTHPLSPINTENHHFRPFFGWFISIFPLGSPKKKPILTHFPIFSLFRKSVPNRFR